MSLTKILDSKVSSAAFSRFRFRGWDSFRFHDRRTLSKEIHQHVTSDWKFALLTVAIETKLSRWRQLSFFWASTRRQINFGGALSGTFFSFMCVEHFANVTIWTWSWFFLDNKVQVNVVGTEIKKLCKISWRWQEKILTQFSRMTMLQVQAIPPSESTSDSSYACQQ